jgi:type IV pilus assembly protein PilA
MEYARSLDNPWRYFARGSSMIAVILLISAFSAAQTKPIVQQPDVPWLHELDKYPGLLPELNRLVGKLHRDVQFPSGRSRSRLLPLLPESTSSYAAFPNYGDVAQQILQIFRKELQENSVLRDWWQHGSLAKAGPMAEDSLQKFAELSQYLGEEIVTSTTLEAQSPKLLVVAEIRKPGLKMFLEHLLNDLAGKSKPPVRVLDPQELVRAEGRGPSEEFLVLVRPDFVVGAADLGTLRDFQALLDRRSREFGTTPFGQRIAQAYAGGVTILGAVDIHSILSQIPHGTPQGEAAFELSGFADMQYLVWEHTTASGQPSGQAELSFTGPRHGAASWLSAPASMGSLDFVSPTAILVGTALLKSPVEILADIRSLASVSNPDAFASLDLSERALNLSLREDLLRRLGGEITFELDSLGPFDDRGRQATPVAFRSTEELQGVEAPLTPVWKAILRVNEPDRLQQTFATLLTVAHIVAEPHESGGLTFYTVRLPSKGNVEIAYAFLEGYLVIGSNRETLARAVRLHRTGESLGKSKKFLSLLPPGHPSGVSAMLYEDPIAAVTMQIRRLAPDIAGAFPNSEIESMPVMVCAYGEKTAIREESTSIAFDAAAILVVAAVAIPNLLRSRIAANEASAIGTIRTANVAETSYASSYPQRGYAPDLATLGPNPHGTMSVSADHAGMIDATLGNRNCTAGAWCTKSGYRFTVRADCKQQLCTEYVVIASPTDSNAGGRNFCSTSDGVIRYNKEPPLAAPVTVSECRAWPPLE